MGGKQGHRHFPVTVDQSILAKNRVAFIRCPCFAEAEKQLITLAPLTKKGRSETFQEIFVIAPQDSRDPFWH
jgi:hypothetical protein